MLYDCVQAKQFFLVQYEASILSIVHWNVELQRVVTGRKAQGTVFVASQLHETVASEQGNGVLNIVCCLNVWHCVFVAATLMSHAGILRSQSILSPFKSI